MTTTPGFSVAAVDRSGWVIHPDFERILADHIAFATPHLEQLATAGWGDIELDPLIDAEVPSEQDTVDFLATIDAGLAGDLRVRGRLVPDRTATSSDAYQLIGAGSLSSVAVLFLIADDYDGSVELDRLKVRTFEQVGVSR